MGRRLCDRKFKHYTGMIYTHLKPEPCARCFLTRSDQQKPKGPIIRREGLPLLLAAGTSPACCCPCGACCASAASPAASCCRARKATLVALEAFARSAAWTSFDRPLRWSRPRFAIGLCRGPAGARGAAGVRGADARPGARERGADARAARARAVGVRAAGARRQAHGTRARRRWQLALQARERRRARALRPAAAARER